MKSEYVFFYIINVKKASLKFIYNLNGFKGGGIIIEPLKFKKQTIKLILDPIRSFLNMSYKKVGHNWFLKILVVVPILNNTY